MKNRSNPGRAARERPLEVAQLFQAPPTGVAPVDGPPSIAGALRTLRHLLDMDVAFVSEFMADHRVLRHVDAKLAGAPLQVGDTLPFEVGYCARIASGAVPGVIPDTGAVPRSDAIDASGSLRIGSHLGVSLRLADGRLFGSVCCFSHAADLSLNNRDLRLLRMFADVIVGLLDAENRDVSERDDKSRRIRDAMRQGAPDMAYQPVFRLRDGLLLGAEALARFPGAPPRSPDQWFNEAGTVGLKEALELQAIRNAIDGFRPAWQKRPSLILAVNASPATIQGAGLRSLFDGIPLDRIALEITEHEHVADYGTLTAVLGSFRSRGCKITVDDAGSGYASLRHILQIEPETIKLDLSLVRGIDGSVGKRALAGGLIEFARQTGSVLIAEGVETEAELATLHAMQVNSAQGYLLGRPAPIADLCRRMDQGGHADTALPPRPRGTVS